MTPALTCIADGIAAMSASQIAKVVAFERKVMACPQVAIKTEHVLHAGMYARTIIISAGVLLTGVLVKIPTLLIVAGDVEIGLGDGTKRVTGYAVIPASAGRKQAFMTYAETTVTMIFPTAATTIEQAESEFTDETDMLFSRRDADLNTITITGEASCQAA